MSGAATAPGQDPSMEDILASIRKILNEEEAAAPPPEPAVAAAPDAMPAPVLSVSLQDAAAEPLDLTEEMLVLPPSETPRAAEPMPREPAGIMVAGGQSAPAAPTLPPSSAPPPVHPAPAAAVAGSPAQTGREPAAPVAQPEPPAPVPQAAEGILAPATAAAASAILGQLARAVAAERSAPVHRGGPSIEDVVREEVRPMLKDWLDTHLPGLVERLVRAEIERVISRSLG